MSNFSVAREYLKKYCKKDEFAQFLLEMEAKISQYRRENVYPMYPNMQEVESVIIRNDFILDQETERLFQTENNMISVGGTHYHEQIQKILNQIFLDIDISKKFKSNGIFSIIIWRYFNS